jgi:hypothetical protein
MRAASPGMQPALTTLYRGWLLPSTLLTCWDLGEFWIGDSVIVADSARSISSSERKTPPPMTATIFFSAAMVMTTSKTIGGRTALETSNRLTNQTRSSCMLYNAAKNTKAYNFPRRASDSSDNILPTLSNGTGFPIRQCK